MNPKADVFFDAITHLREEIVEEAQDYRFRKETAVWKKLGSLAACLCLIASLSLLILPRGCGGSAPDNGAPPALNSSGASVGDAPAPADAPADSEVSGEPMPEPQEPAAAPENGYGQIEEQQLPAVILEIREDSLLVESEGEQVVVSTAGLELPALAEGDTVQVAYTGPVSTTSPAEILNAISIEKIGNDG